MRLRNIGAFVHDAPTIRGARAGRFAPGDRDVSNSAREPLLGYLYQVRVALLHALQRLRSETFRVRFEVLDDVEFQSEGAPADLLQMKHHLKRTSGLGDSSTDLWKSLAIW